MCVYTYIIFCLTDKPYLNADPVLRYEETKKEKDWDHYLKTRPASL